MRERDHKHCHGTRTHTVSKQLEKEHIASTQQKLLILICEQQKNKNTEI